MKEKDFWLLTKRIVGNIELSNIELNKKEILEFHKILEIKQLESYIFPLMEACFLINSYISDDLFQEFRVYLIMQGKKKFYEAIKNPETITDWFDKQNIKNIEQESEYLLSFPLQTYLSIGNNEDDFYKEIVYEIEPDIDENWSNTKNEFRLKYPKLVDKFWNQELIEQNH